MKRKLQVFVSSTFTDLIEERQAAVTAILKAGHIPAGMELFTAGDRSQMKTIERWIDESDVYMLILGGRYGSVEPTSGISYTELEYDYAINRGMPLFSVVIEEAALESRVKENGSTVLEKENGKALADFRKKVLSKTSSFFSDAKDVKLCVHESLSDIAADNSLKGWVSAAEVEDVRALQESVRALREENTILAEKLRKREEQPERQAQTVGKSLEGETKELFDLLKSIEVTIPAEIAPGGNDLPISLLDLAFTNKDALINGVSNSSYGMTPWNRFWYFNVLPKLITHDLAENEKVPGQPYRRSFLNKRGQQFFALIERLIAQKKMSTKELPPAPKPPRPKKIKSS